MGKLRFLTHAALIMRAGYRDANYYFGARILMAAIGFVSVAALTGLKNPPLLIGVTGLGLILPRFILKRMIRDRQGLELDPYHLYPRFEGAPHRYAHGLDDLSESTLHLNVGQAPC